MVPRALVFDEAPRQTARDGIVRSLNRRRHNSCNCGTHGARHSFAAFRGIERARTYTPINSRRTMGTRGDNCAWGRGHSRKRNTHSSACRAFSTGRKRCFSLSMPSLSLRAPLRVVATAKLYIREFTAVRDSIRFPFISSTTASTRGSTLPRRTNACNAAQHRVQAAMQGWDSV